MSAKSIKKSDRHFVSPGSAFGAGIDMSELLHLVTAEGDIGSFPIIGDQPQVSDSPKSVQVTN